MYQKVLVPMDGSKVAEYAMSHVRSYLYKWSVQEVTLLHVKKIVLPLGADRDAIREPAFAVANEYLVEKGALLVSAGIKVRTKVLEAKRPDTTIIDYAKNNCMDLIVIATHGYTGLKKLFFGSVASEVLNQSPIPVLVVQPRVWLH
jgi:nucleotide-binding universal stress UspA family protein